MSGSATTETVVNFNCRRLYDGLANLGRGHFRVNHFKVSSPETVLIEGIEVLGTWLRLGLRKSRA